MDIIIMNYVWLSSSADPSLVERGHHIIDNKNKKNIIHIHGTNGYTDDMNANNDKDNNMTGKCPLGTFPLNRYVPNMSLFERLRGALGGTASRRARSNHNCYHGKREYRRHPGFQACMPPSLNGLKIL